RPCVVGMVHARRQSAFFQTVDRSSQGRARERQEALELPDLHRPFEPERDQDVGLLGRETQRTERAVMGALDATKGAHQRETERVPQSIVLHARYLSRIRDIWSRGF